MFNNVVSCRHGSRFSAVVSDKLNNFLLLLDLNSKHSLGLCSHSGPHRDQVQSCHPVLGPYIDVVLLVGENCSHKFYIGCSLACIVQCSHTIIIHHLKGPGHALVQNTDSFWLILHILGSNVHRELLLGVGNYVEYFGSVCKPHVQKSFHSHVIGIPFTSKEVDDGISLGIFAVENP